MDAVEMFVRYAAACLSGLEANTVIDMSKVEMVEYACSKAALMVDETLTYFDVDEKTDEYVYNR
jgi:hypothetical protein